MQFLLDYNFIYKLLFVLITIITSEIARILYSRVTLYIVNLWYSTRRAKPIIY